MLPPLIKAVVDVRPGERRSVLLGAASFFLVLGAYFVLRPVREAMGVHRDFGDLYWLWGVTLVGMVAANALYAVLASSVAKRLLATCTYRLFALSLCGFIAVLVLAPELIERAFVTLPLVEQPITLGHVFYVWLSVFNLFAVSLFWAQAADRFTLSQAKRLFPLLGAGGTVGALAGSAITTWLASQVQPVVLMGISLAVWRVAVSVSGLAFAAGRGRNAEGAENAEDEENAVGAEGAEKRSGIGVVGKTGSGPAVMDPPARSEVRAREQSRVEAPAQLKARGGDDRSGPLNAVRGLSRVIGSPYLLGISAWMFMLAIASSLMYFTQAEIVSDAGAADLRRKIFLFAQIDLFTQGTTLVIQLTVAASLLRVLGVGRMLLLLPAMLVAGYAVLAAMPTYAVLAIFQAMFRAGRYAIASPARESLFTVVSPEEKYVSKAALDTFVYRAGDFAGVGIYAGLAWVGATLLALAAAVVPLAAAWALVGLWLGRRQRVLAERSEAAGAAA